MERLHALSTKGKLLILFVCIAVGLLGVSIISALNAAETKRNLDTIYFGSLIPVAELNDILQEYHAQIASHTYKAIGEQMSPSEANALIGDGIERVEKIWESYKERFKRNDEIAYMEYASLEIENTNGFFRALILPDFTPIELEKIAIAEIDDAVSHIHNTIEKLIRYEMEIARYERMKFLNEYDYRMYKLIVGIAFIVLIVFVLIYYVFRAIHEEHHKLQVASTKLSAANKMLENASYTDPLTALHNRRYFDMIFERELRRAKREGCYVSFMMLDIDYFKQYNDTYGHVEGDNVLQSVASILRDTLKRPGDYIFRLGGEEFGILLTQTNEDESALMAQKICTAIEVKQIPHATSQVSEFLSVSLGVVCVRAEESYTTQNFVINADAMLYRAKNEGRNRFVIQTTMQEVQTAKDVEEQIA